MKKTFLILACYLVFAESPALGSNRLSVEYLAFAYPPTNSQSKTTLNEEFLISLSRILSLPMTDSVRHSIVKKNSALTPIKDRITSITGLKILMHGKTTIPGSGSAGIFAVRSKDRSSFARLSIGFTTSKGSRPRLTLISALQEVSEDGLLIDGKIPVFVENRPGMQIWHSTPLVLGEPLYFDNPSFGVVVYALAGD
ncbi:MAG: hypothetical protein HOB56_00385 [Proteobacteria bacterium]|nr:hypothetical protein [Pseudomonadota bacterium]MBT7966362.1 hypothetical protein [Pseudomonadota bacterium]